jgi:pimeloyl-ACP methyl ester carboxylesterase
LASSSLGPIGDADLVATLPGFKNAYAHVNGIRLHYVEGGAGEPLVLLPSWPQTWWQFSRVLPRLAERYRVLALDLRGMGGSGKPATGYDKKTMASDVHALISHLDLGSVYVAGNDVGAMVAYGLAANYPEATRKLVMMDTPHPFAVFEQIPLLPAPGTYDLQNPARVVHPWWFAFNQIPELSERVFEGRYGIVQDWLFDYLAADKTKITAHDRAVYAAAYDSADALRAANGWFSSFATDIADAGKYSPLTIPVLGLGGISYDFLAAFLGTAAPDATVLKLPNTGHWIPDEQPDETIRLLTKFFG